MCVCMCVYARERVCACVSPLAKSKGGHVRVSVGWLQSVGSLKVKVSYAKEPYKRDDILQKRPIILRSLLIVAPPCQLYFHFT